MKEEAKKSTRDMNILIWILAQNPCCVITLLAFIGPSMLQKKKTRVAITLEQLFKKRGGGMFLISINCC